MVSVSLWGSLCNVNLLYEICWTDHVWRLFQLIWSVIFAEAWFRECRAQQHAKRSDVMTQMMNVPCLQVSPRQGQDAQRKQRLSFLPNQFFLSFLRARTKTIIINIVTLRLKTKIGFENCST